MNGLSRVRAAFTLLELVIVVAATSVLTVTLASTFSQATDAVRQVKCQSNLAQVGGAMAGFAQERQGRFPGLATSSLEMWQVVWPQILNREYFHQNDPSVYPTTQFGDEPTCGPLVRFWTFWSPPYYQNQDLVVRKYLTCPSYKAWGSPSSASNIWSRPWVMNVWAEGGYSWSSPAYQYGLQVANPQTIHQNYTEYWLGARQDAFASPSTKFLVIESEYGSDYVRPSTSGSSGVVTLNYNMSNPSRPPWTGGDIWSFRHNLGPDRRLYQQRAKAPELYVDCHVGIVSPNDPINLSSRFILTP